MFRDIEWEEAEKKGKNEQMQYYRVFTKNGGIYIKAYKPSIAELMQKRTNEKFVMI